MTSSLGVVRQVFTKVGTKFFVESEESERCFHIKNSTPKGTEPRKMIFLLVYTKEFCKIDGKGARLSSGPENPTLQGPKSHITGAKSWKQGLVRQPHVLQGWRFFFHFKHNFVFLNEPWKLNITFIFQERRKRAEECELTYSQASIF